MKKYIAPILITLITTFSLSSVSRQNRLANQEDPITRPNQNLEDTIFIRNYFCKKTAYLYSKPSLSFKTKIKIPKNVGITTINESGNFEFGNFNVSSNKTFRGWFLKSDLQSLSFTPPKTNK